MDAAAETIRNSWDYVFSLPAMEFLNILCYRKDKNEWEKEQLKKYKREN